MSVKAKVEAIIYAAEEPVTLNQLVSLLKNEVLAELRAEEEARLALNQVIYEGPHPAEDEDDDDPAWPEEGMPSTASADDQAAAVTPPEATVSNPTDSSAARVEEDTATLDSERQAALAKQETDAAKEELKRVKVRLSEIVGTLLAEYSSDDRGIEIREIAGGFRMATKPEHHDVVIGFAKSLKPPVRLSLQALETLAVIAYKQPVTVPEISEVRGVDSAGVIATLLERKLVTTAGRKQVIGRPILYKTTKEFLLRFGLKDLAELPSVEEFEKLGDPQADLFVASEQPGAGEASAPALSPQSNESADAADTAEMDSAGSSANSAGTEATEMAADTDSQRASDQPLGSSKIQAVGSTESALGNENVAKNKAPQNA